MSVYELQGDSIALTLEGKNLHLGIGWDPAQTTFAEKIKGIAEEHMSGTSKNAHDLNVAALLRRNDSPDELVFYGKKHDRSESVHYGADNRTGSKQGEDEFIEINIEKLPADLREIVIFTLIYDGNKYGQTFGEVKNFFLQLKDSDNEKVIYRNDSDVYEEEASKHSAYVLGKIKKDADSWKFIPQHRFSDENTEQDLVDNL